MEKKAETKRHLKKQKSIKEEGARTDQPPETGLRFLQSPVFHFLCIAFVAFLSYSNSFHVPFSFDDTQSIVENPYVRDIGLLTEPLKHYSGTLPYGSRYIGYLTFALNYKFHGFHVTGFHVVNLLIHLCNALLVYLFVLYTFRTPFLNRSALKDRAGMIAFFSGLLFVAHPLQTQAVTYIVQRLTSLASLFYLLSVVLYIKWRLILQDTNTGEHNTVKKNGARHVLKALLYMASALSAVLAMKTKEIAFTLPFMIILYELLFFQGPLRKRIPYLIPIMTTVLIIPLGLINAHKTAGAVFSHIDTVTRIQTGLPRWDYLVTQFRVIVTYIRLLIFPANQNVDYDYPIYHSLLTPQVFLSFLLLLFIGGIGVYLLYRYRNTSPQARIISFGIFWFFITLSVESSIIPIVDVIFEHRVYLPSMGVFISVITATYWISNKYKVKWKNPEKITAILLVIIVLIFSGVTYARNEVWQNNIRLWEDTVSKSPAKARPYYNLGKAFEDKGLYDKALEQFYIALKLNPDDGTSYYHVGNAYLYKGLFDKAIEQYQIALKFMPDNAISHYNLGNAYMYKGLFDKAIEEYFIAIRLKPEYAGAYNNMGNAYMQKGFLDKAIEYYQTALRLLPDNAEAYGNLGNSYLHKGLTDRAIEQYLTVLRLTPYNVDAHFNLGLAYLKKKENDRALREFQTALQLNPSLKEAADYVRMLSKAHTRK